ncbi:MAG TPA: ATP-binding protein [Baekduia sp.]|nr:ATP-binding protein [Baekduia sp.]
MGAWKRSPVLQFAVSGLLATIAIGLIAVAVISRAGRTEAIRQAKQVTRLAGGGIIAPAVTPGVIRGDPAALQRLDRLVRARVLDDAVVRVKLWSSDGRVVYSDESRLIGVRYGLDGEDRRALKSNRVEAEISDLSRPENRFERGHGKLLEVYFPVHDTQGRALLFETYLRFSSVSASGRRLWLAFAPALLGGLLLLQLVNLPLARSLVRRLRRSQHEREALLRRAVDASEAERRLIAADLHDGVVQDLLATSYNLAAHAERLNGSGDPQAGAALRDGASTTRAGVRALRTLLVDIYPPSLHRAGLAAALRDLARTYTARGVPTSLDMPTDLALTEANERLVFRVAQEALRNTHKHAAATSAHVSVRTDGDVLVLEAADDGRGFDTALVGAGSPNGHLGYQMLHDLVEEAGGRLEVTSAVGEGTTVRAEVSA